MWGQVLRYLKAGYSPEQIAGTLARVNPETPTLIYAMPRGELRTALKPPTYPAFVAKRNGRGVPAIQL